MAPDADVPFVLSTHLAVLNAGAAAVSSWELFPAPRDADRSSQRLDRRAAARESPIDLPFRLRTAAACIAAGAIEGPALDDVGLADIQCQPANTATAVIPERLLVTPVELSPTGIVVTARHSARPWFFLGV